MQATTPLQVAVGVIKNDKQQVLIAKRPEDKAHGGCWEFPGGKIANTESIVQALDRELQEELGLSVASSRPLKSFAYRYPSYSVVLHVHLVYAWTGRPTGKEGQLIEWVDVAQLSNYEFPAANKHIIDMLLLDELCFVTPEPGNDASEFLKLCEQVVKSGCRFVQFRCKEYTGENAEIFSCLKDTCHKHGARLVLNSILSTALHAEADGCHLSSDNLSSYQRRKIPDKFIVGASCHDLAQIKLAEQHDLDYLIVGPVKRTATHPGKPGIGWRAFADLIGKTTLPVYAIGGLGTESLGRAWENGAHGVAAISSVVNAVKSGESLFPDFNQCLIRSVR